MIKILGSGDWHANYDFKRFLRSYKQILKYVKENKIDLFVIPGDIFDSRMFADKNYNKILRIVTELSWYCPVLIVYGTPSHDYKGSLDSLPSLAKQYPIMVVEDIDYQARFFVKRSKKTLEYRKSRGNDDLDKAFIEPDCPNLFLEETEENGDEVVMLTCLPWPMKYRILDDDEMKLPLKEQDKVYTSRFQDWLQNWRECYKKFNVPTFLVAHLQLQGSIHLKDQDISSDNHNPADYFDIADFGILGHIHKHQKIKNLCYCGSIYNKTWNELESKYFNVWTVDGDNIEMEEVLIDTPKRVKVECNLEEYKKYKENMKDYPHNQDDDLQEALDTHSTYEIWFVITLPKKQQLDIEKESLWWTNTGKFETCRIELNTLKLEVSERAKNFDIKQSLVDKYKSWCKFKKLEPSDFQIDKIKQMENI